MDYETPQEFRARMHYRRQREEKKDKARGLNVRKIQRD